MGPGASSVPEEGDDGVAHDLEDSVRSWATQRDQGSDGTAVSRETCSLSQTHPAIQMGNRAAGGRTCFTQDLALEGCGWQFVADCVVLMRRCEWCFT